jgi:lipoprotein-releasing system ATP-binding protein
VNLPAAVAVDVESLWKIFPVGDGKVEALRGVSFRVMRGEAIALVGESGSGKSTLLHILGALDSPTSGRVRIGGFDPFSGEDAVVSRFRNAHVGFVFQHNNLLQEFTALENVMMPALIHGQKESVVRMRAQKLIERVGMGHRSAHFPGQLSGGEQQRIAIARALVNNPVLLLADEPSGNLDSVNAAKIHALLVEMNKDFGTTLVIVTHNVAFAKTLPRVMEFRDGSIVGSP